MAPDDELDLDCIERLHDAHRARGYLVSWHWRADLVGQIAPFEQMPDVIARATGLTNEEDYKKQQIMAGIDDFTPDGVTFYRLEVMD